MSETIVLKNEGLAPSEEFMIYMTAIGAGAALVGVVLQFILKSRCTRLRCCGIECDRDVLPADQAALNTSDLRVSSV